MPDASLWLVAYDIADPARLRAVASLCEDYGRRLQQSVFPRDCSTDLIKELRASLHECVQPATDHLAFLPLCQRCEGRIQQHGCEKTLPGTSDTMVI